MGLPVVEGDEVAAGRVEVEDAAARRAWSSSTRWLRRREMGRVAVEGDEVANGRAEEGDAAVGDGEGGRARRWEMRRPAMEREVGHGGGGRWGRPTAGQRREMRRPVVGCRRGQMPLTKEMDRAHWSAQRVRNF